MFSVNQSLHEVHKKVIEGPIKYGQFKDTDIIGNKIQIQDIHPPSHPKKKQTKKMSIMHLTNKNGDGEGVIAFRRTPACYSYSHIVPDTTKCLMAEIIHTSNSNLCIEN